MGKFTKIALYSFWIVVLYYTNLWVYGIGCCFLLSLINIKFNSNFIKLLLPITISLMLFTTSSYTLFFITIISTYLYRCILKDDKYNGSAIYQSFILLTCGLLYLNPVFSVYPILMLLLTVPTFSIGNRIIKSRYVFTSIFIIFALTTCIYISYDNKDSKRAYLHHGVWANGTYEYNADSLKSKVSYSYSELIDMLDAEIISTLSSKTLSDYSELWIVTPTKPFTKEELEVIKEWVFEGGNLIVSSDHTDLFGHARCCNQIASLFNCEINMSATYDSHNEQFFRDSKGDEYIYKTGTNFRGFAFPMWCSWLWEEDAYYMENNFFGPLSPSGDDLYSDKVLLAQVPYGLGQISFIQDSTIFANFCLYQPNTLNLVRLLSSHSFLCRLYIVLIGFMLLVIIAEYWGYKKCICFVVVYLPFLFMTEPNKAINSTCEIQYWTGNKNFVMENGCPYATISTAYSLASLSENKPVWVENCNVKCSDVIWVDSVPPPNPNWRWIKIRDYHPQFINKENPFNELYSYLGVQHIDNDFGKDDFNMIDVNSKFNDAVMNDWWYDSGILENRKYKINQWIAWLNKDSTFYDKKVFYSTFTDSIYDATLHIDKKEPILLRIPKPTKNEGEVYFGNGVCGKIINKEGKISILGLKQYQENIYAPKFWALDY